MKGKDMFPTIDRVILASVILFFLATMMSTPMHGEIIDVQLEARYTEVLGLPLNQRSLQGEYLPAKETVIQYPSEYEVLDTYHIHAQKTQYMIQSQARNPEYAAQFHGELKKWLAERESNYTKDWADCVISLCRMRSAEGTEFVVIDANNDEDLSNDPVLTYQSTPTDTTVEWVEIDTEMEYFDGEKISVTSRKVRVGRDRGRKQALMYSFPIVQTGVITINEQSYTLGVLSGDPLEYSQYNMVWFDGNQNRRWDNEERFAQLHQPITFAGETFELVSIDRFGKSLSLELVNVPPIAIGLPAPLFEAMSFVDSLQFSLSDMRGKNVLIDFWHTRCGPCLEELPYLKNARKEIPEDALKIVSVAANNPQELRKFLNGMDLNWIHIQDGEQAGDSEGRIHRLYQVGGWPTTFLVNQEGIIVAMDKELRGKDLLATLRKFTIQK